MGSILTLISMLALGCGDDGGREPYSELSATGGDPSGEPEDDADEETSDRPDGGSSGDADDETGGMGTTGGDEVDEGPGVDLSCGGIGGAEPGDGSICFFDEGSMDMGPVASLRYERAELEGSEVIYIELVYAPWFVDNTYGDHAIGWAEGHEFDDLEGGDRLEHLVVSDSTGEVVLDFDVDYIGKDDDAPSGFASQGVWKKNGQVHTGDPAAILAADSSLSRNLNERGYVEFIEHSPETDEAYSPNPAAPDWDYRVAYEVWIDSVVAIEGGVEACIEEIYASPSKLDEKKLKVVPGECPQDWDCFRPDGCSE